MGRKIFSYIAFAALLALSLISCKKDKPLTDSGATLSFSTDTVKFDTVFTTVGSATEVFTVINPYSQPVSISSISLGYAASSYFRLNVNGTPGKTFHDVEIGANDSIWIFVEVTLDPNNANTPLIVTDSIVFNTNGHVQNVQLVAYGQDAHFFPSTNECSPKETCTPLFKLKSCSGNRNIHWTNDKPYVIYGYAVLDSGYTLTIDAGTRIHFHTRSGLIVLSTASITVNGTLNEPVTFQGDRLGADYQDVPGQWDRILFSNILSLNINCPQNISIAAGYGPNNNIFNYAIIKNGFVGVECDTMAAPGVPALVLNNCVLKNFASTALYAGGSIVQANNCVFANCGQYCTAMLYGGDYRFLHCTIANYWKNSDRTTPAVYMQNAYDAIRPLTNAYFGNCIIYGNIDNEVGLDSSTSSTSNNFNFQFDHSLIKMTDKVFNGGSSHYNTTIRNHDPEFKDPNNGDYELYTSSIAIDAGSMNNLNLNSAILSKDIKEIVRPQGNAPDLGAYEIK